MDKQTLAKKVVEVAHLRGEFKLRSGQISNEYFDKYRFEARPELLREIAKLMAPLIPKGTEVLAGLEMGGIPIATALSLETGIPAAFVRKEAKAYGTCRLAEGIEIKGKNVLVVEDVITTGGQVLISTEELRELGAKIDTVLCAILRNPDSTAKLAEKNLKCIYLFEKKDLV